MRMSFSRSPYFEDYDVSKNYMRVLYKPGFPVQARELNNSQAYTQRQIETFANHIFKNGSKVSNARSSVLQYNYARLRDVGGTPVDVEQFPEGTIVRGVVSGIKGRMVYATNDDGTNPSTIWVTYLNAAVDGETVHFIPGEDIEFLDSNGVAVVTGTIRCPSCPGSSEGGEIHPLGRGHIFTIDEGDFYFEGMFIRSSRQSVVVSKYSFPLGGDTLPFDGRKIGFDFNQSIVDSLSDLSLTDPSLGYPNATAPGADRYSTDLILTTRSYDAEDGEQFLLLARMNSSYELDYQKSDSDYADLMDNIAKRTYETNGNYTLRPFKVSFYEHKKESATDPYGWDIDGDPDSLVALLTPSVAYVRGYRVETIADTPVLIRKARDTRKQNTFVKRFDPRTSLRFIPTSDLVWPGAAGDTTMIGALTVNLHDELDGGGTIIGTVLFNDLEKLEGDNSDKSAVYRYTITDLTINSGRTLSEVKSAHSPDTGFVANAVPNETTEVFEVENAGNDALVFRINQGNIKSLRDSDNPLNGSMTVTIRKKLKATLDGAGTFVFNSATDEFFVGLSDRTVGYVTDGASVITTFDLTSSNVNITETTLNVDFGGTHAGKTVTIFTDVIRTNVKEKTKTLIQHTYTTSTNPTNLANETFLLGKADAFDITKIEMFDHTDPGDPVFIEDATNQWTLSRNTTDWYYGESSIRRIKASTAGISNVMRLHVTFRYFEHSGTAPFFSVDSYSDVVNDPLNDIEYKDIPVHVKTNGDAIPLISALDFRPIRMLGSTSGTVPTDNSTALFDCEFYLPRADLIQIDKNGLIYPKYGAPSETPMLPKPDQDAMVLYHVFLNAYTYSLEDVKVKFIENKRYTMRDIGRLEDRIKNVEYYTTLSLLEQSAATMSIKDANGLDRFKNGLLADDFTRFQATDLGNLEFRAALDRTVGELRPRFQPKGVKLVVNKDDSVGVKWHGNIATLPYTEEVQSENPYATKSLSINPYFIFSRTGSVVLSPNFDTWTDDSILPEVVADIDTGAEALRNIMDASGLLGTNWGSWVDQNSTIISSESSVNSTSSSSTTITSTPRIALAPWQQHFKLANQWHQGTTSVTTTTTSSQTVTNETISTTQTRTGTDSSIELEGRSYTIDNIVKDVQIIPFARARVIQFYGSKLRPNTRLYAFFDGEDVSSMVRNIGGTLNTDNQATMLDQIAWGSPIYTDSEGNIVGEFNLPEGRFFNGKSEFKLSDDPTGEGDPDVETTKAIATYFSGGLDVTKQDYTMNIQVPILNEIEVSETRELISERTVVSPTTVSTSTSSISKKPKPATPSNPTPAPSSGIRFTSTGQGADPVANQFFVEEDQFLTAIDLYFQAVDQEADMIWVEIRSMVNGYPSNSALTRREFKPSEISFSDDSSVAFRVEFFAPVFVKSGTDYCFVVGGASPDTRIWVAKLGDSVVNMPGKIVETQPTLGSSFRSQNGVTWNAEQFETIKYRLYCALFTDSEMTVAFENQYEDEGYYTLPENPVETQAGLDLVRIHWPAHGFTENDRIVLSLDDEVPFLVQVTNLPPQIGQFIHTPTGSGYISSVEKTTGAADEYRLAIKKTLGRFIAGQSYTADSMTIQIRDNLLLSNSGIPVPTSQTLNEAYGLVLEDTGAAEYIGGVINGVPIDEISMEHAIRTVDTADSFIVQVTTPASVSGRSGGAKIRVYDFSIRYEAFNVSGSYMGYNAAESWEYVACGHGTADGIFASEDYLERASMPIIPGRDYLLDKPAKVASKLNETRVFGSSGQKSIKAVGTFTSRSPYLTPVVDCSSFSAVTVTNHIGFNEAETFDVAPNAILRLIPETDPLNGSEQFKSVTANVNLANPAADLMIYLDYNKDVNADFNVYVKKVTPYETLPMDQLPWLKVDITNKQSSNTTSEFVEGGWLCSEHVAGWMDGSDEPIQFIAFKIKIVGRARNSARPPRFKTLRAIAVT